MVACTKACSAGLAWVQPEAAGSWPPGPVSWYGVARPAAVSGRAGTMSSQSMFCAAAPSCAALGLALGVALAAAGAAASLVVLPPDSATIRPRVRPSAIGTATGTITRARARARARVGVGRRRRALRRAFPVAVLRAFQGAVWRSVPGAVPAGLL